MAKFKRLPSKFIRVDKVSSTISLRGKGGRMTGRAYVKGKGDGTRLRRVAKNVDVDKDGKIDFQGGTLLGRTKIKVKASDRSKGYLRQI